MAADYAYTEMIVNGKALALDDIVHSRQVAATPFEAELFSFVREWRSGAGHFEFQTSGSTGEPAKVTFTRQQLVASARRSVEAFDLHSGATALVCLNPRYVAGRMMLVRAFVNDMKIIAVEPSSNPLADVNAAVDFLALVPLQLQTMIESGLVARLRQVRTIIIGGASMSRALRKRILAELSGNVYQTYGMTETLTHVALDRIDDEEAKFTALPGVRITLDERGCLVIQSGLTEGTVVTNDIAELLSDGVFRLLGRYDNVINSGGVKLIPEVIEKKAEAAFARLNMQNNFFIAGMPHDRLGAQVTIFVEGVASADEKIRLENELRKTLDMYEIPRKLHFLPAFVYTENGKINRIQSVRRLGEYRVENP